MEKYYHFSLGSKAFPTLTKLACEYSRFSLLLVARDVSAKGTCATQRQKFHTDDVNQYVYTKTGGHGVPNVHFFDFMFLLDDYGKGLCMIFCERAPAKLGHFSYRIYCFVIDSLRLHFTWLAIGLSFVNNR